MSDNNNNNNNNYSGEEDEKPADVVGAKFFGGSAVKDELFDVEEEESALELIKDKKDNKEDDDEEEETELFYNRFEDDAAFPNELSKKVSYALQLQINDVIHNTNSEKSTTTTTTTNVKYSNNLKWISPLAKSSSSSSSSPMEEIQNAKQFYNRIDIAVISASSIDNIDDSNNKMLMIRWEISLLWPSPWQPQVLLTGSSTLTLDINNDDDNNKSNNISILSQVDKLDDGGKDGTDILSALSTQLLPRFWDMYHIGMSPAAERSPLLPPSSKISKGFLAPYDLHELPPRLYIRATLPSSSREYREADMIPNHAFVTAIKTMGPNKQSYVPTTPVQVSIVRRTSTNDEQSDDDDDGGEAKTKMNNEIQWIIPLPPQFSSNPSLPLPPTTTTTTTMGESSCTYQYNPSHRLIATIPYSGSPQDSDITTVRKQLYDAILKDGLKPKMDVESGGNRPLFFVVQNDVKACFTSDGLGMAVYEWRPEFARGNFVGIELEM